MKDQAKEGLAPKYEYTHGGDIYDKNGIAEKNMLDFSANINPLGIPQEALRTAKNALDRANIYPDSGNRLLISKLSEFEAVATSSILCTNGASDILFRLVFAVKPQRILVAAPSFADYERAGRAAGAEIIYYMLKKENGFNIENDIIDAIHVAAPDIVFLCNPNNPTANLTNAGLIEKIAATCETLNSLLLVDECFLDFVDDAPNYSAKPWLERYKILVVLKAFTKTFAMPGLRLGYALCADLTLLDRLKFCGPDWAVSNVAQEAGIAALENGTSYLETTREYVKNERDYLTRELASIGMTVYPSKTNFIFFHCPYNNNLDGELRQRGIAIRNCANFPGLEPGYFRLAVLTSAKNHMLIQIIKEVMALWQSRS